MLVLITAKGQRGKSGSCVFVLSSLFHRSRSGVEHSVLTLYATLSAKHAKKPRTPRKPFFNLSSWRSWLLGVLGAKRCAGQYKSAQRLHNRLISNSRWKTISLGRSPASFRN